VQGRTAKWFKERGYHVPTHDVQLWAVIKGKLVKNGIGTRVKNGTKIIVKIADLPPASNVTITRCCNSCGNEFTTTYGAYLKKKESDRCAACSKKGLKGDGSHGYWVEQLIVKHEFAKCDISGEADKRFLVLHHLNSRSIGGKNTVDNYVVLSANYHLAFHMWCGGTNISCTADQYKEFKMLELRQTDMLADDWSLVE
jgi:hypothetical protein